jgi:hypothetical protein
MSEVKTNPALDKTISLRHLVKAIVESASYEIKANIEMMEDPNNEIPQMFRIVVFAGNMKTVVNSLSERLAEAERIIAGNEKPTVTKEDLMTFECYVEYEALVTQAEELLKSKGHTLKREILSKVGVDKEFLMDEDNISGTVH